MSLFNSVLTAYSSKVNGQIIDASDVNNLQTDVQQIEKIMGQPGDSSVVGTYEYLLKSPASDGGGHVQVVNKGGTGQTSYTKGDILIASSNSVLTKLAIGLDATVLTVDSSQSTGIKWNPVVGGPTVRVYTNPSILIWNKPSVLSYIEVEVQGGGGTNHTSGGGAGGYSRRIIPVSSLVNAIELIMVGSVLGRSSFGTTSYMSGNAGYEGQTGTGSDKGGSSGGAAAGGDINITGGTGGNSDYIGGAISKQLNTGFGGPSYFGGSGAYGSGGVQGVVIIKEY